MSSTRDFKIQVSLLNRFTAPIRAIQKSLNETRDAVKANKDQLRQFEAIQRKVGGYQVQVKKLNEMKERLGASQEKLRLLNEQLRKGPPRTAKFAKQLASANKEVHMLSTRLREQRGTVIEHGHALRAVGFDVAHFVSSERRLQQAVLDTKAAMDRQNNSIDAQMASRMRMEKVNERFQRVLNASARVGKFGKDLAIPSAAMTYWAYGITQAVARFFAPGLAFGKQMSNVQAELQLGKSDPLFLRLKEQAQAVSAATGYDATEVGAVQATLARSRLTPQAILGAVPYVTDLAKGYGMELAEATELVASIRAMFKIDPSSADGVKRIVDTLSTAAASANLDMNQLADTMKNLQLAEGLKVPLEEVTAYVMMLGDAGIKGEKANAAINNLLKRLSAPGGEGAKMLDMYGISITDRNGDLRDRMAILDDLYWQMEKMGNVERAGILKGIFGEEAAAGINELIRQRGTGRLPDQIEKLKSPQAMAAARKDVAGDNLGTDIEKLTNDVKLLGTSLEELNQGPLREFVQGIRDTIKDVRDWTMKNQELVVTIAKITGVVVAVVGVLGVVGMVLSPLIMIFSGVSWAVTGFIWVVKNSIPWLKKLPFLLTRIADALRFLAYRAILLVAANPVIAGLAVAIGLLAIAFYLFYKNWDEIKSALGLIYDQITELGANLIDGFVKGFTEKWQELKKSSFGKAVGDIINFFKDELGIHSPSRVFQQLGQHTLAGYRQGLEESTRQTLATVSRIGKQVTTAGAGLVVAGGLQADVRAPVVASTTHQPSSITIHIHAAPGMSERAIAAEVARVLDERNRQQAVRNRSRLGD